MKTYPFTLLLAGCIFLNANNQLSNLCKIIDHIIIPEESIYRAFNEEGSLPKIESPCSEWTYTFFKEINGNQAIAIKGEGAGTSIKKLEFPTIFIYHQNKIPDDVKNAYQGCYLGNTKLDNPYYYLYNRMEKAVGLESKYFKTEKGLYLGMSVEQLTKIYGNPHIIEIINFKPQKVLKFKWEVFGEEDSRYFKIIPKEMICTDILAKFRLYVTITEGKVEQIEIGYDML